MPQTYDVTNKNRDHQESQLQSTSTYIDVQIRILQMPKNSPTYNNLLPRPCPTSLSPIHISFMWREYLLWSSNLPTYLRQLTRPKFCITQNQNCNSAETHNRFSQVLTTPTTCACRHPPCLCDPSKFQSQSERVREAYGKPRTKWWFLPPGSF